MPINELFHAMSDPTRREIIRMLKVEDRTAGELAEHFSLAKSTLSGHFNVLRYAGLIVSERHGTKVVYSLNVSALEEGLATIMELFGVGEDAVSPSVCRFSLIWRPPPETPRPCPRRRVFRESYNEIPSGRSCLPVAGHRWFGLLEFQGSAQWQKIMRLRPSDNAKSSVIWGVCAAR